MPSAPSQRPFLFWLLAGCLTLALCMSCLAAIGLTGLIVYTQSDVSEAPTLLPTRVVPAGEVVVATPAPSPTLPLTSTPAAGPPNPLVLRPTLPPVTKTGTLQINPPAAIIQEPVDDRFYTYLEMLMTIEYPVHDFYESARRLSAYDVGPRTVTVHPYQLGDRQTFYTAESTTEATLMAITEHTYFWVDEGLAFDPAAVAIVAERFEQEYYPRLVNLFGQEWQPGVDNDPHFSVLHLGDLEGPTDELGYFDSGDEFPRSFYSVSNQQEILYMNMDNLSLGSDLYYGTLVHEFQHLVQWYVDGNETAWLNEGLSQLAELYVGLDTAESRDYLLAPDTQLNTWNYDIDEVYAHYGNSYLFTVYLWEQLGEAAVQELARHPANGLASVRAILQGYRPETTLIEFMADWVAATYLDDPAAGSQYAYDSLALGPVVTQGGIKYTPYDTIQQVPQYGTHYLDLDVEGKTTVTFAGSTLAELVAAPPHSGAQMWLAPAQENVNAQLTARFDLSDLEQATLTYWTWYDLAFDLDYAYVSISTDEGQNWELLAPGRARAGEYGPAYHGRSDDAGNAEKGGWIEERVSLNSYVGQPVLIRFELLTYYDSDGSGFAVDDIAIPELGYMTDVEAGADGWQAAGFVRSGRWLPQEWVVQLIQPGNPTEVQTLSLNEQNQGQWTLEVGPEGGVLAITALTPFIYEPAHYWLNVSRN